MVLTRTGNTTEGLSTRVCHEKTMRNDALRVSHPPIRSPHLQVVRTVGYYPNSFFCGHFRVSLVCTRSFVKIVVAIWLIFFKLHLALLYIYTSFCCWAHSVALRLDCSYRVVITNKAIDRPLVNGCHTPLVPPDSRYDTINTNITN